MPEPKPNESQKDYMRRCVPYMMDKEGKTQKQAVAQCIGMHEQMSKKARKRAHAG